MSRNVYILENLGCANCASKIERKVAGLPGVEEAVITFATKQLRLTAEDPDALIPQIQEIANALEPDIVIKKRERRGAARRTAFVRENEDHDHAHHHEEGEACGCGHDHGHEHHHHHEAGEEACSCDHDHNHEYHHHEEEESCGCDHDHDHEHYHHEEEEEACGCGHNHDHEHHHHHEEGEACGCGHNHDHEHHHHEEGEACGCGHDHGHEHHHNHEEEEACGCGHDHGPTHDREHHETNPYHVPGHPDDCQCELCHPHAQYCDVCGQSLENCTCEMPDSQLVKQVFILENLGCANCAAKMEKKIRELPAVKYASITFTTKQLRVSSKDPIALLPVLQRICSSIESEVRVVPRSGRVSREHETRTYIIETLDCANCASKMEQRINALEEVSNCTITFATKQMKLSARNIDRIMPQIQEICDRIEPGTVITEKKTARQAAPAETAAARKAETKKEKKKLTKDQVSVISIIIGAILFVGVEICHETGLLGGADGSFPLPFIILFVIAYLILGGNVLLTAGRNLTKGQIFDENFLMAIATLGAFVIGEYPEAVGVMLFYRIGELFEHIATERSRSQIMEAVDLRPEVVNLLIGEDVQVIPAEEANVGDILLVRPGDRIPLDGIIIDGESRIDTSPVTGEPVPVTAKYGDEVLSGCVNTSGVLKIRVEKVLEESMVTRILDSVENAAASKPHIDKFITRFSRVYTPCVVIGAALVAVVPPLLLGQDWYYWVYTALSFLVMSCPCALVLSVPLAFFSGIGAGSKKGILFKGGVALESLAKISAVVMDKTGTITKGNFVVQDVESLTRDKDELLAICAAAEMTSTHPIAHSIVEAAKEKNLPIEHSKAIEEIAGQGIRAELSVGTVLCGNVKLLKNFDVNLDQYQKTGFGSEVLIAVNGVYEGYVVISDTIKEEAPSAIGRITSMGIVTAMLTGDAQDSAEAVAKATGVQEVHARLLPQDKLNELRKIRDAHGSVMFVGDGINDAPVLAGADVGAAMGSGADAAIEAADVVFMNSNMDAIPDAISIAKKTSRISGQNVVVALAIKAVVLILGITGIYSNMWLAVFADTGVSMLCILNSIRILYGKQK